ncbi:MAG: putative peptidoglycan binding domain-containing protein, partial [Acidimicrobiia bacterium]
HRLLFPNPRDLDFVDIDDSLAGRMAVALSAAGFETNSPAYDESLRKALFSWMGNENLEMRWSDDPIVDRTVLGLLLGED